ncbi:Os02g0808601, partial [Oryza sativa Japonica Group]
YLIRGPCVHFDIKFIFCGGEPTTVACHWGPHASPRRCTAARAWRTPTKPTQCLIEIFSFCTLLVSIV